MRSFDPADKQRLIDAFLQADASLSSLALKTVVNANQLRKWVQQRERSNACVNDDMAVASPAFVRVAIAGEAPVLLSSPATCPIPEPEQSRLSPRPAPSARLSAHLPNGVKLEFECSVCDTGFCRSKARWPSKCNCYVLLMKRGSRTGWRQKAAFCLRTSSALS
jgi:transposase